MATNKTIQPTGETIVVPAMSDQPDASVFATDISKIVDAVNAENDHIATLEGNTLQRAYTFEIAANSTKRLTCTTSWTYGYLIVCSGMSSQSHNGIFYLVTGYVDGAHGAISNLTNSSGLEVTLVSSSKSVDIKNKAPNDSVALSIIPLFAGQTFSAS